CSMPYSVASQMSRVKPGIIAKSAEDYVRSSLDCVLLGDRCHGSLAHEILAYVYGKIPHWITYTDAFLDKMADHVQNCARS
ncbi:hypothetical protein scyTo_0020798, partial [Scyliorhinus torazame]|nr:hypothetical protein [Scyliorhinus torazame]